MFIAARTLSTAIVANVQMPSTRTVHAVDASFERLPHAASRRDAKSAGARVVNLAYELAKPTRFAVSKAQIPPVSNCCGGSVKRNGEMDFTLPLPPISGEEPAADRYDSDDSASATFGATRRMSSSSVIRGIASASESATYAAS